MVALKLPLPDILYRGVFALLLNIYVYLINDYCDVEIDLSSSDKDRKKAVFLNEHRKAAIVALFLLAAVLGIAGILMVMPQTIMATTSRYGICLNLTE